MNEERKKIPILHVFYFFIFLFLPFLGPSIQYLAKQKSWQLLSEENCFQVRTLLF